jgi:hypothetical protein
MKKTIFLAIGLLVAINSVALAADFKPLSIPNYTIRMPDGVVLPDRDKLILAEKRVNPLDSRITMFLYNRPEKIYIADNGEFLYPYMEMTITDDFNTVHLLTVSFINENLEIEMYQNKAAFGDFHQDEMMKITGFKQRGIREFNFNR